MKMNQPLFLPSPEACQEFAQQLRELADKIASGEWRLDWCERNSPVFDDTEEHGGAGRHYIHTGERTYMFQVMVLEEERLVSAIKAARAERARAAEKERRQ